MKRLQAITTTVFLSVFLGVAANAATTGAPATPQGIQNLKKVMQHKIQHEKDMHALQDKGLEKMKQLLDGKKNQHSQQAHNK